VAAAVIEFCLLGPLRVRADGAQVRVPRGNQRVLLAALLLQAGRTVTAGQLAELMWGASPPPSSAATLQNYVKRLRGTLGRHRDRIVTQPGGYLIRVDPGELDMAAMEGKLAGAHDAARQGAWPDAAMQATAALALWRGEPLCDVDLGVVAAQEVARLTELRFQARALQLEAGLRLGRHAELAADARQLTVEAPLREQAHALLMRVLYQCGRRAEALEAYQDARRILVDELGCEPGPELRALHREILQDSPVLRPAAPPAAQQLPVPRQLPAAVAGFTGRAAELKTLTQIVDQAHAATAGTVVISAIGGTAGVGKTALALHWAHQVADRFTDGQLYVNLRGYDPSGTPAGPAEAVRGFLGALGVAPQRIPPQTDAQAGLYRSLLADRKMLIVLDNARDEAQVRPLLPASPGSLVLVTSRNQLAGLAATDGARLFSLDVLAREEAVQLLTARLGADRAAAEAAAVGEIAALCAHLPLALAVAAARAAGRPRFPLAVLAAELRASGGWPDALDSGDPAASVRAVFSWSYRQLSPEAARLFRLLGLHPGPDISVPAAASLAGCQPPHAHRLLAGLGRAHLITEHAPGRYSFHDLLRAYAASQARATDSRPDRHAAISRVLDHYLHTAIGAPVFRDSSPEQIAPGTPGQGVTPEQITGHQQAWAWFEAEHRVLRAAVTLAADSGFNAHAWQLPWAMAPFWVVRGHYQEDTATQRTALAAATRLGDTAARAVSSCFLASAYSRLGDHDRALPRFADALACYRQLGDRLGEAMVHWGMGESADRQGRYCDAISHSEQAFRLYQAAGHKAGQALTLNNIGWYHALLGNYQQARTFCEQALALSTELADLPTQSMAWDTLGYIEHHLGSFSGAAACYQQALSLCREIGALHSEAAVITHLGDTHYAAGEPGQARNAWQQAVSILTALDHPDADTLRAKLADIGDPR
jgi:DNA-binding SARP family transcriptional activator/tetratricopeptide (TPR) repeat protein